MLEFLVTWIASIPSLALPYALASVGLIISERAGVLSLGAEGFMLVGALFLIPVILMYTGWSYWVFRGKVRGDIGYH